MMMKRIQPTSETFIYIFRKAIQEGTVDPRRNLNDLMHDINKNVFDDMLPETFRHLVGGCETFGDFGMPIARHDPFLHIVALTSFQPFEMDRLTPDDFITMLTPIYRVLHVLTVIRCKLAGHEGFENTRIVDVLPYKPRDGFDSKRYYTLTGVVASVWLRTCHAFYKRIGNCKIVTDLICFTPSEIRAHYVWLHILDPNEKRVTDDPEQWIELKATTFTLEDPIGEGIGRGVDVWLDGKGRRINISTGKQSVVEIDRTANNTSHGLSFTSCSESPYVGIKDEGDWSANYFLLITNGRDPAYNCFFRNAEGELTPYPLWFTEEIEKDDPDDEILPMRPHFYNVPLSATGKCATCGKTGIDLVTGEDSYTYCDDTCIQKSIEIQERRRKEEARTVRDLEEQRKKFNVAAITGNNTISSLTSNWG